jgi:hypothetical protein
MSIPKTSLQPAARPSFRQALSLAASAVVAGVGAILWLDAVAVFKSDPLLRMIVGFPPYVLLAIAAVWPWYTHSGWWTLVTGLSLVVIGAIALAAPNEGRADGFGKGLGDALRLEMLMVGQYCAAAGAVLVCLTIRLVCRH